MAAPDTNFTGSIPALYDECLGPLLFEPYASDLAQRVASLSPQSVLETAAGTGIVTRELVKRLGPSARICSTDLNQAMLDIAAAKLSVPNLSWQQADATALPFDDAIYDVVACQFGVMFFPDKHIAFGEARRVLAPGGRFLFNVWDRPELNPIADIINTAAIEMFPENPPLFIRRVPYGYNDADAIALTLEKAGFRDIVFHRLAKRSRGASAREVAVGFCQGTPLRNAAEAMGAGMLDALTAHATRLLENRYGTGPVEDGMQAIVFSAIR